MMNIFKNKKFKHGSLATIITIGFIVLVVLANIVINLLVDRFSLDIDVTKDKKYQITQTSIDYLKNLNKPIKIYALASQQNYEASEVGFNIKATLDNYIKYSKNITIEYIDIIKNPEFISKYSKENPSTFDLIVESGGKYKVLKGKDLFDQKTIDAQFGIYQTQSLAEQKITSAIMFVTDDNPIKIAILNGNDSGKITYLTELLSKNNYVVEEQSLLTEKIPEDYNMLIIATPKSDYNEQQLKLLDNFLSLEGKSVFYFADVSQPELPNLEAFLNDWGISIGSGTVVETNQKNVFYNSPLVLSEKIIASDVLKNMNSQDSKVLVANSREMEQAFETQNGITTTTVVESYNTTVLRPKDAGEDWNPDNTKKQPYPSIILSQKGETKKSSVIAFSSLEIVNFFDIFNGVQILNTPSVSNGDLIITLSNLLNQKENVKILPKDITNIPIDINASQVNTLTMVFMIFLPLAVIIIGSIIWYYRRRL